MVKRGTLIALDPEETRRAMLAAIARGIEVCVDKEVLDQWRISVLSCTATFHTHMQLRAARVWSARDGSPGNGPRAGCERCALLRAQRVL